LTMLQGVCDNSSFPRPLLFIFDFFVYLHFWGLSYRAAKAYACNRDKRGLLLRKEYPARRGPWIQWLLLESNRSMKLFPDVKKFSAIFLMLFSWWFLPSSFALPLNTKCTEVIRTFCGFRLLHLTPFRSQFGDCQLRVIQESFHCYPSL
jgi:hypothetical protein